MFKSASIFSAPAHNISEGDLEKFAYVAAGPTQEKSIGFVPPREKNGAFAELIAGNIILKVVIETRSVPGDALKREVERMAAFIEEQTGRKPGKKERRDLTDEARLTLLPQAFSKLKSALVWIDVSRNRIVIDSTSGNVVDAVITLLVNSNTVPLLNDYQTNTSPAAYMASVFDGDTMIMSGRAAELAATDETGAKVKYTDIAIDARNEITDYLRCGYVFKSLELLSGQEVQFTLTDKLKLKKILINDKVEIVKEDADAFDATVAITCGTLAEVIDSLVIDMGGLTEIKTQE